MHFFPICNNAVHLGLYSKLRVDLTWQIRTSSMLLLLLLKTTALEFSSVSIASIMNFGKICNLIHTWYTRPFLPELQRKKDTIQRAKQQLTICIKGITNLCSSVIITSGYSLKDQGFVHVVVECKMSLIHWIFKTPWEEPYRLPLPNPRSFASIPTYEIMVYFLCTFWDFSSWDRTR